ncbi:hypothetical protein CN931_19955 [Bacillus sp. AFS054943]|nr:hypothetical protein CN402_14355 [Bacillus sp. AFS015896]PGL80327.1 hypothetical protein CN931_19955 [Bacillus sp. AFS054943]
MLAGSLGASPQELNVTEYRISLLLRTIELAVRLVQLLVQVEQPKSSFLVGDIPTPAEFRNARRKALI